MSDYIPPKDADLAAWALNLLKYGEDNAARLKLDQTELADLRAKAEDFDTKRKTALLPTHSALDIAAKNTARTGLEAAIRDFVQGRITHNHGVTDEDRIGMGLKPKDHSRTPSDGTSRRVVATLSAALRQVTVHYHDEDSQSRGKPAGIHGCELRRAFLDGPPASIEELTHSEFSTATPFIFNFDESQRGKHLYMSLRWETTRSNKGPWSPIYDIFIP